MFESLSVEPGFRGVFRLKRHSVLEVERQCDLALHLFGLGFSALVAPALILRQGVDVRHADILLPMALYVASMVGLFLASGLYHHAPTARWSGLRRRIDRSMINFKIAACYTVIVAAFAHGGSGWLINPVWIWLAALIGVGINLAAPDWLEDLGVGFCAAIVVMSATSLWFGNLVISPAARDLIFEGALIIALGMVFYVWDRFIYSRTLWHLHVVAGVVTIFLGILNGV